MAGAFADHEAAEPVDLVHFVHSLYYMADLGATLDHALAMVRPAGLLVAVTAPRRPLCVLTELLSPGNGHRLWCAEDVTAELAAPHRAGSLTGPVHRGGMLYRKKLSGS